MGEDPDWRPTGLGKTRRRHNTPYFLLFITFLALAQSVDGQHNVCGSIDIRNDPKRVFNKENMTDDHVMKYMNCTLLEGTFSLSMITNTSTSEEDFISFPNLVEITGYLLVFNVRSLTTLSRIFPNLRVIGGSTLIMNYALIIYQNADLRDIGLPNLRVIRQGGVRISDNPSLCYAVNIDWKRILFGQIDDVLVVDGSSSGQICSDDCDDLPSCHKKGGILSCWNGTTCQESCPFDTVSGLDDGRVTVGPGCLIGSQDMKCHDECIGGCYEANSSRDCAACRGFLNDGQCVDKCPKDKFQYLTRCIAEIECQLLPEIRVDDAWRQFKVAEGKCSYDCPTGYEVTTYSVTLQNNQTKKLERCAKCSGHCPKKCRGKMIDSAASAKDLTGCNIIDGNLDIQLREPNKITLFSQALSQIEVITGALFIRFSPALTSLHAFSSLREVRGTIRHQERYSIVIYENPNLKKLFPDGQAAKMNVTGYVQVQNNRMLCYKEVLKFLEGAALPVAQEDQSVYSNGDKAICEETVFELRVERVLSEGFILNWTTFNVTDIDHRKFLGYQVFYKRVDHSNISAISIDQDRSVCQDTWQMHFESTDKKAQSGEKEENKTTFSRSDELRALESGIPPVARKNTHSSSNAHYTSSVISHEGILPNSYYAAYVLTKMVNHPGAKSAKSNVIILKTLFNTPTPPRITKIEETSDDSLTVEWEEPARPNGVITHYVVSWTSQYRDQTYNVKHVCEGGTHHHLIDESIDETTTTTTTPASTLSSMFGSSTANTCSAAGCCQCPMTKNVPETLLIDGEEGEEDVVDHNFENAVQNIVFVPSCHYVHDPIRCHVVTDEEKQMVRDALTSLNRTNSSSTPSPSSSRPHHRRHVVYYRIPIHGGYQLFEMEKKNEEDEEVGEKRINKRSIPDTISKDDEIEKKKMDDIMKNEDDIIIEKNMDNDISLLNQSIDDEKKGPSKQYFFQMPEEKGYLMLMKDPPIHTGTKNVTEQSTIKKRYTITGLKHYTLYQISMIACQNVSVDPSYCSVKPVYKSARTKAKREMDLVNASSITPIVNGTDTAAIIFNPPSDPNGRIRGFKVIVTNVDGKTPFTHCVNAADFAGGVTFEGLADGSYYIDVRTISMAGISAPVRGDALLIIKTPSWFTTPRIVVIITIILLIAIVCYVIMRHTFDEYYGKRMGEYIRQTITANPEYLSQFEVYKQDEWELDRSSITLGEEIGRGTFGKVYRGFGNNLESRCGAKFGECAVKTVSDEANPAERVHFLMEASVMKQFNSSFIIHLYGVVSDGQPVLVVMEMMAKGNLRDYLRSRRPDAEENINNLPVPSEHEYIQWAAQIADGMAYLEHIKFCHRDLAARNCMIGADEVVKIGDFGMARDIYYHEYYKPTGKRMMPVRWMSPESLKDGKFTTKSDVWSYGIVLYEMLTLAQQPYQGLGGDQFEVFQYIGVKRKVLEKPIDCPDFWYGLMCECWKYQPRERPTFRQIVECLYELTDAYFRERSWVVNDAPPIDPSQDYLASDSISLLNHRTDVIVDEDGAICIDNRRQGDVESGSIELVNKDDVDQEDSL